VQREMMRITRTVAARTLCGGDIPDTEAFGAAAEASLDAFFRYRNPFAELCERLPLPATLRMRRARRTLRAAAQALLEREPAAGGVVSLLRAHCPHAELAVDEVVTILLSGHETTATSLTWTWYLLERHPHVAQRLHAEVDAVLARAPLTHDALRELRYARQVVSEAMRLYPPVWAVSREAVRDIVLAGHEFPAGAVLMVAQYTLHRDARWWPDPRRFEPDRFAAHETIEPYTYLPFSTGPRGCIGERFAWAELTLALAALSYRWRLHVDAETPVGLRPGIVLEPDRPIRARLAARRP
jgi:cytochrome P450